MVLQTEQHISHIRTAIIYTITSLQGSEGEVISVPGVHELLNKIHYSLDRVVSKQIDNASDISVYHFNSASRQYHEAWTLQSPFLYSFMDTLPPSGLVFMLILAGICCMLNTNLPGMSQVSVSMRVGKARFKTGLWFNVQKWSLPVSDIAPLTNRPLWGWQEIIWLCISKFYQL